MASLMPVTSPLIGGTFAEPFSQQAAETSIIPPGLRHLLTKYPYLLPNLVTSALALLICALALLILDEVRLSRSPVSVRFG